MFNLLSNFRKEKNGLSTSLVLTKEGKRVIEERRGGRKEGIKEGGKGMKN